MARRKNTKADDTLVDIAEVKAQAESFFETNQKYILGGIAAIAIVIGGWFAYKYLYIQPKEKEAIEQISKAQEQFEKDSFKLALTDPGSGFPGFLDIIEKYSGTKAANSANFYAGVCYLHLGQFDAAIQYLKEFDAGDEVLPISKNGALGDAYAEKGDLDQAMSYYKKAVDAGDNEVLTAYYLKKVGMLNEKQGNFAAAKKAYETIKEKYPNSPDGLGIDKFIARAGAKS
ncbi:MAG TPA: tetratricopeptide repeat protein [Saprospiraceae bacterium]|nr:tetratricopeptide repeat protein [Saprospiraceae bacterium]